MHPELLKEIVALCKRRKEQGDHPTEPIADAEVLENAIVQQASNVDRLRASLQRITHFTSATPRLSESGCGRLLAQIEHEAMKALEAYRAANRRPTA